MIALCMISFTIYSRSHFLMSSTDSQGVKRLPADLAVPGSTSFQSSRDSIAHIHSFLPFLRPVEPEGLSISHSHKISLFCRFRV